jgi:multiple sugar transport system permease protein
MTTTAQIPLTIIEPEKRSKRRGALSRTLVSYSFLAPWLIGFLGLTLGPTLASLYLSFTNFDLLQDPQFIGLANYQRIVTNDVKFLHSMQVTFTYVILAVPLKLAFALGLAMVLNRGIAGLPLYRALFYLPSLLGASVAIAVLWRQLFAKDGLANVALGFFGIQGPSWISDPNYSLYTLVLLSVWQFGSPMIIFLAGLRQIPPDVYEAASCGSVPVCSEKPRRSVGGGSRECGDPCTRPARYS